MYSIVLMAAISGGPNTAGADATPAVVAVPAASVAVGCTGCSGYVSSYGCCGGYSYGCCGGSCHGKHGGGFLGMRNRGGCCGGGGFLGHKARHSCHGCGGGYSCHGGHSCSGCYGSGWGSCHGFGGYSGYAGGCNGCYGSYSYPTYGAPVVVPPAVAVPEAVPAKPLPKTEKKTGSDSGASLKFRLPAGATLFVDGNRTAGEGTERSFFTPPLAAGQKYFYDVRAELVIDGQTVTEEKRVVVEAGADQTESFPKLLAAAGRGTTVAGK